ncbi:MAG: glycerophosphodiester phosphodiesterase [Gammaproteobacteria bacterium]|nr:glycerophosphodiester phosphodiesterase [Gammaproteobacteria bacterium]
MIDVIRNPILLSVLMLAGCAASSGDQAGSDEHEIVLPAKKLVIAHRGASGYLPEHTIAAKAMAYAQGADYIEQDLVMTKDGKLVVLHDRYLDTVTDVASVFPGRNREDGRFYVIDFTLAEIKQLSVSERFETEDGAVRLVFKDRFPLWKSSFRVHTFAEEIELIQGLNDSTGKSIGLYPEMKSPAFHRDEGKDIASATLDVLMAYGYKSKSDKVFLQCFDPYELQRIYIELMPERQMSVRLIQLISTSEEYRRLLSADGMKQLATFVDGIGPSVLLLIEQDSTSSSVRATGLTGFAHAAGLKVHPYTFRRERDQMPPFAKDYDDFLRIFFDEIGVDGVFTDFPDLTVQYLEARH